MNYEVQPVADDEIPGGREWLLVEREGQAPLLLVSGSCAACWRFMRAWEDTLEPPTVPTILLPAPRLRAVG